MVSSDVKMEDCAILESNSEDLHLLVHDPQSKNYGIKGAFGKRCTLIPPPELLTALMSKKNKIREDKKAAQEVKPIIDPKDQRDAIASFPLDPNHDIYVFGASKGVRDDRARRYRGEKRVKATPEEAYEMIYENFKKQPYWTLKALGIATQQPDVLI